jgi:hypothetical protein
MLHNCSIADPEFYTTVKNFVPPKGIEYSGLSFFFGNIHCFSNK